MAYTGTSIVDYLKSVGKSSSFADRQKLAAAQGISNYTGTAAQNTQLLGALQKPAAPAPTAPPPASVSMSSTTPKPLASPTPVKTTTPAPGTPPAAVTMSSTAPKPVATPTAAPATNTNPFQGLLTQAANAVKGAVSSVVSPQKATTPAPQIAVSGKAVSGYTIPKGVTDVAALQRQLNSMGANLAVDGAYGKDTDAAVAKYMSGMNASPTKLPGKPGVVGAPTKLPGTPGAVGAQTPLGGAQNMTSQDMISTMRAQNAAAAGTQGAGTPAAGNVGMTLRDAAKAAGFEVNWDPNTQQVTLFDPNDSSKTVSFKANEGEDLGISDSVGGQHRVADPMMFARNIAEALQQSGIDMSNPQDVVDAGAELVQETFDMTAADQVAEAQQIMEMMMQVLGIDRSAVTIPDVLTFDQAKNQAAQMFDPLYDEQKERLQKQLQEAAVRSGFAGQLPWTAYEMENQGALERQRTGDIANAAQTLVGQSKDAANAALDQAAKKRAELFQLFNSAMQTSQGNRDGKYDILTNWMTTLGQNKSTQLQNQKTEKELKAYDKYELPMLEQKLRAAKTDAEIAEVDLALKNAELAVADQTQRLKLQALRQDIANAANADARAAALHKWSVQAAEYGVALDAIQLESAQVELGSKAFNEAKTAVLDMVDKSATTMDGARIYTYQPEDIKNAIKGYPGLTAQERDALQRLVPVR